jgi:NADH:ubiquinone oxidoreductase subunit K
MLAATLFAIAVASGTSAAATPQYAGMFLVGLVAAALAAVGYAVVVARLVLARRSGSAV